MLSGCQEVETVQASSVLGLEPHRALDIRRVVERRRGFPGQAIACERRGTKTGGDGLGTRHRCHTHTRQRRRAGCTLLRDGIVDICDLYGACSRCIEAFHRGGGGTKAHQAAIMVSGLQSSPLSRAGLPSPRPVCPKPRPRALPSLSTLPQFLTIPCFACHISFHFSLLARSGAGLEPEGGARTARTTNALLVGKRQGGWGLKGTPATPGARWGIFALSMACQERTIRSPFKTIAPAFKSGAAVPHRPNPPGRFDPGDARSEVLGRVLRPFALVAGFNACPATDSPVGAHTTSARTSQRRGDGVPVTS